MHRTNYYCAGPHCRRTTRRLTVRLHSRTYYYCVDCGRRLVLLELAAHPDAHVPRRAG
jgi:hypothetical protein